MRFDEWTFRGSVTRYDKALRSLATNELPAERWGFTDDDAFSILRNYITYTFEKLSAEREDTATEDKNSYIYEDTSRACFNTGLLDKHWQYIYFTCDLNTIPDRQKWHFYGFFNEYTIPSQGFPAQAISTLRRPNYFDDPSRLVFDVKLPIIPQWQHIIDDMDNFERIPPQIRQMGPLACRQHMEGAIATTKRRIEANYKTAVPQYYKGKIQLLVPLYLTNPNIPDLALVLSLSDDRSCYYGHTCLTIDMAYNNARLIAKPESFWLHP